MGVTAVIAAGACIAAGVVAVTIYFSHTQNQYVVALTSFAPLLILLSVVGAVVAAVARRWILTVASIAVVTVGATLFGPLYLSDADPSATNGPAAPTVRVMQSNLMLGLADPNEIVRLVSDEKIDVLTVQELTRDAEAALDAAGMDALLPHRFTRPTPGGGGGAGIYSRFPMTGERELPVFTLSNLAVDLDVGVAEPVRIYTVHPVPPYPSPAPLWASEMGLLKDEFTTTTGLTNVIVSGDFNSTRSHSRFRDILDIGYDDAADRTGSGLIPTYPTDKPYPPLVGIDHILTRGASATSLQRITLPGSDHHGLIAQVSLVS